MGRTLPTATMRVYQFEHDWKNLARAPRAADREAFAELVAFAHFHAAPLAHAASPYGFEMIVLTMLVGLVRRAEALDARGVLRFYAEPSASAGSASSFQTHLRAVMFAVRQRLAPQGHELSTFGRALRREDQHVLLALFAATSSGAALVPQDAGAPSDEMLLAALVRIMRRLRQLEKQYGDGRAVVSADEWSRACAV